MGSVMSPGLELSW